MNTPPTMNQSPAKWYYMGQDEQEHGPFDSRQMIQWNKTGYFNDMLLLRTENDSKYYPLVEWTRLCGTQLPFHFPIISMEALVMDRVKAINLSHMPPPPPPAPTGHGPIMVSATFPPPPPPPNGMNIFSPTLLYATGVPPPPISLVNGMYMGLGQVGELENPSSTVSNTPESEPLMMAEMMQPSHREQATDGTEMPWLSKRYVERGTSPVRLLNIANHKGTQTETLKVSASEAASLLAGMFKMPIEIVNDVANGQYQHKK